eukprot:12931352-Prorocentrum_lima.AAC.1
MAKPHNPLAGENIYKSTLDGTKSLEQHDKQGHVPKRMDCPVCQDTSGPVARQQWRSVWRSHFRWPSLDPLK